MSLATFGAVIWFQLRLHLRPASNGELASGRANNRMAAIVLMFIVVVGWLS